MNRIVKITLHKDPMGTYAIVPTPPLVTLAEEVELAGNRVETMTLTWVLEEHPDNPDQPNARKLTIKFGDSSPFVNDTTGTYITEIGTDSGEIATDRVRVGSAGEDFRLYKYDIVVTAKGTEQDDNGAFKDVDVNLDPHVRVRRGTVSVRQILD